MLVFDCGQLRTHSSRMDFKALIATILQRRDVTQAELARRLNVTQPTVSRWKSGRQDPEPDQREAIIAEAASLGIIEGSDASATVPIVGYVGGASEVFIQIDAMASIGRAAMPPIGNSDTVALVVRGDSLLPIAENDWVVYYDNHREPPTDSLIGKLCIVGTSDGRTLIKRLYQGRQPSTWDLHAPNASPLLDQAIAWAARVTWIKPK